MSAFKRRILIVKMKMTGRNARLKDSTRLYKCGESIVFSYKDIKMFVNIRLEIYHDGISKYKGL